MQYKVIYICSAKPRLNKTVLRRRLKDAVVDWWSLMSVGRLFQTRGAATANAVSELSITCSWQKHNNNNNNNNSFILNIVDNPQLH